MCKVKDYQYYLFDLDGTLIDTREIIFLSFEYILGKYLNMRVTREEIFPKIGIPLPVVMREYFGPVGDGKLKGFVDEYRLYQMNELADTVTLFPGVGMLLQMLAVHGRKCALVTSRGNLSAIEFIRRLSIESFFPVCLTMESTVCHKPHPEPALKAMDLLGAKNPSEVLFVGDSEFDIGCGKNAGVDTALAMWGLTGEYCSDLKPDYYVRTPMDLL